MTIIKANMTGEYSNYHGHEDVIKRQNFPKDMNIS